MRAGPATIGAMLGADAATTKAAPRSWALALMGLALGCYSALCGIGGGVFAVPILVYGFHLAMPRAVANSLVLVAASTTSATLFEAFHPARAFHAPTLALLVPCALAGTWLGYRVAKRLPVRTLKQLFVALLAGTGAWVLVDALQAHDDAPRDLAALALGPRELAWIGAVGFVSGVLAPLMGIGGGLVAVPGLLYLVPGLGYLGARAASLAMSTATAWTSVALYRRDGTLEGGRALPLAAGAALGAALGIQLVHVPGVAAVARGMVSLAMFVAAARFLADLRTRPVKAP